MLYLQHIVQCYVRCWWWGCCSPPLAYSIIRYKVFSVSITSNNWTATNRENCYLMSQKHEQVRLMSWMATHLCLDDSEFSWCVPLETTKKNTIEKKMNDQIHRFQCESNLQLIPTVSESCFTPFSHSSHTHSDMMPFLFSWPPFWGQLGQAWQRGPSPEDTTTHQSDWRVILLPNLNKIHLNQCIQVAFLPPPLPETAHIVNPNHHISSHLCLSHLYLCETFWH